MLATTPTTGTSPIGGSIVTTCHAAIVNRFKDMDQDTYSDTGIILVFRNGSYNASVRFFAIADEEVFCLGALDAECHDVLNSLGGLRC